MERKIHIGTSGWSYKHWRELYYPPKLAASKWLPFYAADFSASEINASFYKLPTQETAMKWASQVPADFIFCPKMSRFLTHMKKLRDPEEPVERFFSVFHVIKDRLGPVLIQLHPLLKFNYDTAEHFYTLLKKEYRDYEFVVEVRQDSWLSEESLTLMTKYDIGLVISQSGGDFPYCEMITAKNIYVRFHGPKALYASPYSDTMLRDFARKFRSWVKEGHIVWAFFNNDIHGYAPVDAKRLQKLVNK